MAGRFARIETRRRTRGFVFGLLADLPRKNCWSIAEHAGDRDPHGMQHLLNRAVWDTDGVRDDLRDYLTTHLGDDDAVLVVDETGDLKKGVCTVGVQRQYCTASSAVAKSTPRCTRTPITVGVSSLSSSSSITRRSSAARSVTDAPQATRGSACLLLRGLPTTRLRARAPARRCRR